MRKEIIETGKTVDAAIDAACVKLGIEREACEWEIIDLPKKTFLGLKTIPAKVRVSIDLPDEKPAKPKAEPKPQQPKREAQPERRQEQKKEQKPRQQQQEAAKEPRKKPEKKAEAPVRQQPVEQPQADSLEREPRIRVTEGFTEKETHAMNYIAAILRDFGLSAELQLFREGSGICIDITGDGLGTIIGRRGETLDAIQYLTGLVVNRLEGDYLRVTVDCGDYRMKRKDTLEALAKKLAAQVLKTNTSKTLEPMNPFERRVIHATVSNIEGVSSSSIGEEPNRRVVITSPTARRPSRSSYNRDRDSGPRSGDRDRDRGGDRGSRGGRDRDRGSRGGDRDRDRDRRRPSSSSRGPRPQAPATPLGPPKETPESSVIADTPMGKLDLD